MTHPNILAGLGAVNSGPDFEVLLHWDSADATNGQTTVTDKTGNYTFTRTGTSAYSNVQSRDASGVSLYTPAGSTFRTDHNGPQTTIAGDQDVTYDCWLRYPEFGGWTSMIGAGDSGERATCFFGFHDDRGIAPNNGNILVPSSAPPESTWFHFAWVREGTTATMYFDSSSVWTGTNSDAIVCAQFEMPDASYSPTGGGYIDSMRITLGALSPSEFLT